VVQVRDHIETERRALRAELQLSDSRDLTHWIDQHIEAERHAIARELHDELGQSVTAVRTIADEASRLYDAMHGIIPRLTPLVLDSFGLREALHDLLERTRRSQPEVAIALHADTAALALPAEVALTLYRAAQEGLTNALRHGQARQVRLDVTSDAATVRLSLRDDGIGLPASGAARAGHYGLRWLAERVESLNGVLRIEALVPHGVLLDVAIPLPERAAS
jgi:two-component system, NarL family, sensor histidine kinase UhpB